MQTNQEPAGALERRLDMAVPLAEIDKEVQQRLKQLARTMKMPGFRPGKVPFNLVVQQYGAQARSEAIGQAVERAFGNAVREQKLRVAGYPRIEPKGGENVDRLEFSAVFEVYPDFVLNDVSGAVVERPVLEVGQAEVDKTLQVLRDQRKTFAVADRPAEKGDRVVVDFTGRMNGEVFKGGQATDFAVMLGGGRMLPDFEKAIEGMSAGQTKVFDITFPEDYPAAELAGKPVSFEVTVKSVEGPVLPEVDAEFAKSLGIADGDLARMRDEIKANLEREVKKRLQARIKQQAMNALVAANPIEAPKSLIEQESNSMANAARQDLAKRGVDVKEVPVETSWFAEESARRVKLGLIVSELVKAHGLHATPEQVRAAVDDFAQTYENPAEVVRWYYSQNERLGQLEVVVIEDNVVQWVMKRAQVRDVPISFDELMGNAA